VPPIPLFGTLSTVELSKMLSLSANFTRLLTIHVTTSLVVPENSAKLTGMELLVVVVLLPSTITISLPSNVFPEMTCSLLIVCLIATALELTKNVELPLMEVVVVARDFALVSMATHGLSLLELVFLLLLPIPMLPPVRPLVIPTLEPSMENSTITKADVIMCWSEEMD